MKFLRIAAVSIGSLLPLAGVAPAAAATVVYDWTLSVPSNVTAGGFAFTGSGTLTVTTGVGSDTITAITGSVTNGNVTDQILALAPKGTLNSNDNLLFPIGSTFTGPPETTSSTPYVSVSDLDTHGIAFTIAAGTIDVFGFNVPNASPPNPNNNNYGELSPGSFGVGQFAVTATPLPAALPLFAGGLAAIGLLGRRRKRKAQATAA
jgi:hypothetical protein